MGRSAYGVKGITLDDGDEVVSGRGRCRRRRRARRSPTILTVTDNGYGKRTELAEYRVQSRGGKGIITIKTTERNGPVVAALPVVDADEVMLITNRGMLIRMPAAADQRHRPQHPGRAAHHRWSRREEQVVGVARVAETQPEAEDGGVRGRRERRREAGAGGDAPAGRRGAAGEAEPRLSARRGAGRRPLRSAPAPRGLQLARPASWRRPTRCATRARPREALAALPGDPGRAGRRAAPERRDRRAAPGAASTPATSPTSSWATTPAPSPTTGASSRSIRAPTTPGGPRRHRRHLPRAASRTGWPPSPSTPTSPQGDSQEAPRFQLLVARAVPRAEELRAGPHRGPHPARALAAEPGGRRGPAPHRPGLGARATGPRRRWAPSRRSSSGARAPEIAALALEGAGPASTPRPAGSTRPSSSTPRRCPATPTPRPSGPTSRGSGERREAARTVTPGDRDAGLRPQASASADRRRSREDRPVAEALPEGPAPSSPAA